MTMWRCFINNNTGKIEGYGNEDVLIANILYWTNKSLECWLQFARKHTKAYTAISYNDETGEVKFLEDFEENVS